jgi:hypothetical protein
MRAKPRIPETSCELEAPTHSRRGVFLSSALQ